MLEKKKKVRLSQLEASLTGFIGPCLSSDFSIFGLSSDLKTPPTSDLRLCQALAKVQISFSNLNSAHHEPSNSLKPSIALTMIKLTSSSDSKSVGTQIISQAFDSSQMSPGSAHAIGSNGLRKKHQGGPSPYRDFFGKEERQKPGPRETRDDWQDTCTFTTALERIEAWIYARVIESIWWQTLTPHMQCPAEDGIRERRELCLRKRCGKLAGPELSDSQKFSIELWKKALSDACQRLCPVRAGGHECGCLSVFARMVMEQCVARLDVAMFNAILRESEDDMPTDPISDPISDPNVLPISIGKLSFGAGAQLKNAVGSSLCCLISVVHSILSICFFLSLFYFMSCHAYSVVSYMSLCGVENSTSNALRYTAYRSKIRGAAFLIS
eukprot:Gb_20100 [translate_table: standard]